MIAIVDYGMGNVLSVRHAFEKLGHEVCLTDDINQLKEASHIVLPGVGSFKAAMEEIESRGLKNDLIALAKTKPFLGICLGMQLLFTASEEVEQTAGLNLIPGVVRKIKTDYLLPHIGWNQLTISHEHHAFRYLDQAFVYFVHTYQADTDAKYVVAEAEYGEPITAMVRRNNIFGIQFHPEKSADVGANILKTFLEEVST